MVLALFEYMNAQLVERQANFFIDPGLPLSTKWDVACDYLDADLASGYVRVLQEMIAAAWAHPQIGAAVRTSLDLWLQLHKKLAQEFEDKHGSLAPLVAEDKCAGINRGQGRADPQPYFWRNLTFSRRSAQRF
jgi:hypothetical protein